MEPIKTALCSFGMSGRVFHAPFISTDPHFKLYAVLERSKEAAREKYPDVISYKSLDEMLADKLIELVVVNTPNYTHYEYSKKALEANKHVIVEKPFVIHSAEGRELIDLAKKNSRKLSVYHNRRFDSDYRTVKKILDEEWIGMLVEGEIHFDRYKYSLSPKLHKETPGPGTGVLYDLGSHIIDQSLQLFGKPKWVFADIRIIRPHSQVDDYFELLLYYPEFRIKLHASYLVREPLPGYVFHGTKGSFIKHRTDIQETMLQAGVSPATADWGKEPESEKGLLHTEKNGQIIKENITSLPGNYADYYEGIYESVRNERALPVNAEDALKVISIIEKAFLSSREKKAVQMDP